MKSSLKVREGAEHVSPKPQHISPPPPPVTHNVISEHGVEEHDADDEVGGGRGRRRGQVSHHHPVHPGSCGAVVTQQYASS